jgi:hypothetical protein
VAAFAIEGSDTELIKFAEWLVRIVYTEFGMEVT